MNVPIKFNFKAFLKKLLSFKTLTTKSLYYFEFIPRSMYLTKPKESFLPIFLTLHYLLTSSYSYLT